jgi:hypothetical protein
MGCCLLSVGLFVSPRLVVFILYLQDYQVRLFVMENEFLDGPSARRALETPKDNRPGTPPNAGQGDKGKQR